jgi:putative transposase
MSQSFTAIYVHLVFSTKGRHPWFTDPKLREELHHYLGGISNSLGCPIRIVGGVADHVHLLGCLGKVMSPADWVKELKRVSNLWLKEKGPAFKGFEWQRGYGAFSVSHSNVDEVIEYIANQEQHHRKFNFQDELRALLKRHNIEWDERYIWD